MKRLVSALVALALFGGCSGAVNPNGTPIQGNHPAPAQTPQVPQPLSLICVNRGADVLAVQAVTPSGFQGSLTLPAASASSIDVGFAPTWIEIQAIDTTTGQPLNMITLFLGRDYQASDSRVGVILQ